MARLAPIVVSDVPRYAGVARSERGRLARRDGRRGEWLCALILMAKGYRLIGFRLKTHEAEIDILAVKGGAVAVIEVKRRASLAEALEAVTPRQRDRLLAAARQLAACRPDLEGAAVRLDLMALAPGHWPSHIRGAWPDL
ncbi:MAG TPA: YraN family protein [Caulobacteraceae bacterium]|jgi:putative endonuclease|nr:YraN family protein [Caulobacteraceae bacterium]